MAGAPKPTAGDGPQSDLALDELREMFDGAPVALIVVDLTHPEGPYPVLAASDDACRLLRYDRERIERLDVTELWVSSASDDNIRARFADSEPVRLDAKVRRGDGTTIQIDVCARVRVHGERTLGLATAREPDRESALQHELRSRRERLDLSEEFARVGSVDWNLVTGDEHWSDGLYALLGLEPGSVEPCLASYVEHVHPDDRELVLRTAAEVREHGEDVEGPVRVIRADGSPRVFSVRMRGLRNWAEKLTRIYVTIQDVTESARMQRRVSDSEAFLRKAQEVANLGSWSVELATGLVTWSDELYRICGITPAMWDGRVETFMEQICVPEDRALAESTWELLVESGEPRQVEYRVRRPSGEVRHLLTRGQMVFSPDGQARSVVGASQDVTDIRLAQEALRLSEERLELAIQGSTDGLWDWPDIRDDTVWVSPRYAEMLGYGPEELMQSSRALTDAIHPDDRGRSAEARRAHFEGSLPFDVELRMRTKTGEYRWFRMRGDAVRDADGRPRRMAGSLLDIHAQKTAEARLHLYQARLRSLAASVSEAAERERRRIAAELHDRTVQTLGALRMKLDALRAPGPVTLEREHRDEIFALIDSAIHETRELLQEIGPPILYELGFEAAVEWLGERAEKQYGLRCTTEFDALPSPLAEDVQMALFQCIRELLTNTGKHARASSAHVSVVGFADRLVVETTDDGMGFQVATPPDAPTPTGGFGLFSVRERLRVVGGTVEIASREEEGRGTRITLTVPNA